MHRRKRRFSPQATLEDKRTGGGARHSRSLDDPVQPPSAFGRGKTERLHRRVQHHKRGAHRRANGQRIFSAAKPTQQSGKPPARGRNFLCARESDDLPNTVCGPHRHAVLAVQHRKLRGRGKLAGWQIDQDGVLPVETAGGA
ncbi:hypothetical protein D3C87_1488820 [compost metagenome]